MIWGDLLFLETSPFVPKVIKRERLADFVASDRTEDTSDILLSDSWILSDGPV